MPISIEFKRWWVVSLQTMLLLVHMFWSSWCYIFAFPHVWPCILWFYWSLSCTYVAWATLMAQFSYFLVHLNTKWVCTLTSFTTAWTKLFASGCLRDWWKYIMTPIISAWKAIGLHILSCSWSSASCLSLPPPTFGERYYAKVDEAER